jgi:hypothetical protein
VVLLLEMVFIVVQLQLSSHVPGMVRQQEVWPAAYGHDARLAVSIVLSVLNVLDLPVAGGVRLRMLSAGFLAFYAFQLMSESHRLGNVTFFLSFTIYSTATTPSAVN